ncbi:transcription factor EGL1-like isoform X1 [Arachis stenosperma]|uniref:transcription factor EGL1-like isoform X1 n=1 Tax=Arachis stenosperma TaxID=217475 RepID=UPI0025ABB9ED|nr:transcription factor EGL1-like isoform X1 [Arachis stenosperma]
MVPEKVKKQLALAVRSIQWSYAIFWSSSPTQPGVLSWGEGYYNGDIKTRKTSQVAEHNSDQIISLQRSEQLRELYSSLADSKSCSQTKRPSAALSPEDLTDTEWFYLVCMSFVFNIGQGLPGRSLAYGQPIWLCNAHSADNGVFCRSLLAKSASIQTVVCFPFLDGVIELGTTDPVSEDYSLIQVIRNSFLDILETNLPNNPGANLNTRNNEEGGVACGGFDHNAYGLKLTPEVIGYELINITSPTTSSNALQANQQTDGRTMFPTEFSNCFHNSRNSSDCLSENHCAQDLQQCNDNPKTTLVNLGSDDKHYQRLLSALPIRPDDDRLIMRVHLRNFRGESSFAIWKQLGSMDCQRSRRGGTPQNLLKKVLFEVPLMHMDGLLESQEKIGSKDRMRLSEVDDVGMNHALSERKRRAKLNERFLTLRSMVPTISKDDKVSILDDAMEYLRKLEEKVRKLEAEKDVTDLDGIVSTRTSQDMVERASDNNSNKNSKSVSNKRRACEAAGDEEMNNSEIDVGIYVSESEVVIEMKCPWREGLLLETVEALSSLHLDCHSLQSSKSHGTLYLTIKSKFRGANNVAPVKRIRRTLQKAAMKS